VEERRRKEEEVEERRGRGRGRGGVGRGELEGPLPHLSPRGGGTSPLLSGQSWWRPTWRWLQVVEVMVCAQPEWVGLCGPEPGWCQRGGPQ